MAISAVRRGGVVTVVGVYGMPYDNFPLGQIFDKGITLRFGQAPAQKYIDERSSGFCFLAKLFPEKHQVREEIVDLSGKYPRYGYRQIS